MTVLEIQEKLFELQDIKYKDFQAKLIPTVDAHSIIGVRVPALRDLAKEIYKTGEYQEFLQELPHKYCEEMTLHGLILCQMSDYDKVILELDRFLPYVDNWATCDIISPKKAFKKNLSRLEQDIMRWTKDDKPYVIRFGVEMLMSFFLDNNFKIEHTELVSKIQSEEYYVNMMRAWYFATALAKQWDCAVKYIEERKLDEWTLKKTIQKARESYRITPEQKQYLSQFSSQRG